MNENKYPSIGQYVKEYRKSNGYTQQSLADRLGIERTNLAKIETGASHGSLDVLIKISDLIGVSVGTLIGHNNESRLCIDMTPKMQNDFLSFCRQIGMKPDSVINLFVSVTVREQRIPFDIAL